MLESSEHAAVAQMEKELASIMQQHGSNGHSVMEKHLRAAARNNANRDDSSADGHEGNDDSHKAQGGHFDFYQGWLNRTSREVTFGEFSKLYLRKTIGETAQLKYTGENWCIRKYQIESIARARIGIIQGGDDAATTNKDLSHFTVSLYCEHMKYAPWTLAHGMPLCFNPHLRNMHYVESNAAKRTLKQDKGEKIKLRTFLKKADVSPEKPMYNSLGFTVHRQKSRYLGINFTQKAGIFVVSQVDPSKCKFTGLQEHDLIVNVTLERVTKKEKKERGTKEERLSSGKKAALTGLAVATGVVPVVVGAIISAYKVGQKVHKFIYNSEKYSSEHFMTQLHGALGADSQYVTLHVVRNTDSVAGMLGTMQNLMTGSNMSVFDKKRVDTIMRSALVVGPGLLAELENYVHTVREKAWQNHTGDVVQTGDVVAHDVSFINTRVAKIMHTMKNLHRHYEKTEQAHNYSLRQGNKHRLMLPAHDMNPLMHDVPAMIDELRDAYLRLNTRYAQFQPEAGVLQYDTITEDYYGDVIGGRRRTTRHRLGAGKPATRARVSQKRNKCNKRRHPARQRRQSARHGAARRLSRHHR